MTENCRFCGTPLERIFADLGDSPLANSFVTPEDLTRGESVFPLRVFVCDDCLLVQLPEFESPEKIFSDYAYFSSYAASWLEHCRRYVDDMTDRFSLGEKSQVVEIASNDGYLLQFFQRRGIPVLGIEPAANVARVAAEAGIETQVKFFGESTARELVRTDRSADLLLGNNVLAHVPDLNDFVQGLKIALAPNGVITMEFPHVLRLIEGSQFDTIYHEHFSYFSLHTVRRVFAHHQLRVFDVDELTTHGGSLRIYATHGNAEAHPEKPAVSEVLGVEEARGLTSIDGYLDFDTRIRTTKERLLEFLRSRKSEGASIVAYGAPAKGNTLLNYCGIGAETIDYVVDKSPHKQGRLLPGSHLPIFAPEKLASTKPDYVFVLPWNLRDEITSEWARIADWGGRFFVAIPEVELL